MCQPFAVLKRMNVKEIEKTNKTVWNQKGRRKKRKSVLSGCVIITRTRTAILLAAGGGLLVRNN